MAPTSLIEPNAPSTAGYFTDKWRKDKTKQTNKNNNKIIAAARSWRPCWSVVALTLEGQLNHQKVRNLVCMCFLKMVRRAVVAEKIGVPGCFCKTQQSKPRSWTHLLASQKNNCRPGEPQPWYRVGRAKVPERDRQALTQTTS